MPYRALIVGTGPGERRGWYSSIGYEHARAYLELGHEVVGGVALSSASVERFASTFDATCGSTHLTEALQRCRPDVVSVATFADSHRRIIDACIEARVRAIWCEKPLALTITDARHIVEACERADVRLIVNHVRRYFDGVSMARDKIASGAIGGPLVAIAASPGWDLLGWGSHWVDTIRALLGDLPACWVMGQVDAGSDRWYGDADRRFGSPLEDAGVAYIGFEGGVRGLIESGEGVAGPPALRVFGMNGSIELTDAGGLRTISTAGERTATLEAAVLGPEGGFGLRPYFVRALRDLLAWREGGPEPPTCGRNALASTEIMLAAYESALRGGRIDLPFEPREDRFALDVIRARS